MSDKVIIANVRNYAKHPPIVATKESSIKEIVNIMVKKNIGMIIIVDKNMNPVGVVTERDIVKSVAKEINMNEPVSKIMSSPVITIEADEPIWKVADIMKSYNIRHLVVMDKGKLYGVISIRDLVYEEMILENLALLKHAPPEAGKIET
jgi:CBS domain-containing protein